MDKRFLVIKWDVNSFERAYNDKFSKYCDVLSISDIYDVHSTDKNEKKNQIKDFISRFEQTRLLSSYEKIIVFEDINIARAFGSYLDSKEKVHLWYWNIFDFSAKDKIKLQLLKKNCSIWTFDEGQAKSLGINHSPLFYLEDSMQNGIPSGEYKYDLFFVGLNKGRKEILGKIESICKDNGLRAKIVIVGEKDSDGNITPLMEYPDTVDAIRNSRVLLEINREDQVGLTTRALEALYYNKPLVTNNRKIFEKEYFGPENAYVLDINNPDGLVYFIKTASPFFSPEAYEYYSIAKWFERF